MKTVNMREGMLRRRRGEIVREKEVGTREGERCIGRVGGRENVRERELERT